MRYAWAIPTAGEADSCKESSGVCVECYADRDCSAGYSCLYGMCAVPAYAQWTWMSGSNTISQTGIYGTKGMPDAANVPGAREDSISWTDGAGNLWLFGGYGTVAAPLWQPERPVAL